MGKIKARGQFHQIKNEDTGASSTDSQDYTDHTVTVLEFFRCTEYEIITGPSIFNIFGEILGKICPP